MHTTEAARRKGIGSALVNHLLAIAKSKGMKKVSLETGSAPYFAPARALYEKMGFRECAPFADYKIDPNSVFMTIDLVTFTTA
jgi:putative acetyltransferase